MWGAIGIAAGVVGLLALGYWQRGRLADMGRRLAEAQAKAAVERDRSAFADYRRVVDAELSDELADLSSGGADADRARRLLGDAHDQDDPTPA